MKIEDLEVGMRVVISDDISITDDETQQEILICAECEEMIYFQVPKKIQNIKGYEELTIQAIEQMIDNEIDDLQLQRKGIEI